MAAAGMFNASGARRIPPGRLVSGAPFVYVLMANRPVVLDCQQLANPHLAVIDQLARLQLALRRDGCELLLANADGSVLDLIGFAGLAEVLRVEVEGHPEEGEQPRGVKEKG